MAARTNAPLIGDLSNVRSREKQSVAQARENSAAHHLDVTFGYRFQHSTTPFNGTFEEKQAAKLGLQPRTTAHLMDVFHFVRTESKMEPDNKPPGHRGET